MRANLHGGLAIRYNLAVRKFRYIDDVEAWLEPMDYQGFWVAIAPYDLVLQSRAHCDAEIAAGDADTETVLDVLKYLARIELTQNLDLKWRLPTPWLKLVSSK